jgi:hypothetical protein
LTRHRFAGGIVDPTPRVTVPRFLRPGLHTVAGACLTPDGRPLFLRTTIVVTVASAGGGGGGGSGDGGSGDGGASVGDAGGGGSGAADAGVALTALDGPRVPDDAAALFEEVAEANGVTEGGDSPGAATRGRRTRPRETRAATPAPSPRSPAWCWAPPRSAACRWPWP